MPDQSGGIMLYDLSVEIRCRAGGAFVCGHEEGEAFRVVGEDLVFDKGKRFSLYAMAAVLPLLPAKQRSQIEGDWMVADTDIACPDAACGAVFRIKRIGKSAFPVEAPNTR